MRMAVVLLLLLATALGTWQTRQLIAAHQQSRFDYEVRRIDYAVAQRMNAYVQVLRGGLGLFQASDEVTRQDWLRYVETLHLGQRYPGFKALSFLAAVKPQDLPAFIARARAEPLPLGLRNASVLRDFKLLPPIGAPPLTETLPLHAPVFYVAPLNADNELAIGRDQMQEPGRRRALALSVATGEVALTPRVRMPQVGGSQVGFIAYLAVLRDGEPRGWLTAAFFADGFMGGLLGETPPAIAFEIHDSATAATGTLLYSTAGVDAEGGPRPLPASTPATLRHLSQLDLPGRQWTVRYATEPGFVPFTDRLAPWLVAVGGLLATLLFYAVARAGAQWRAQAARLAQQAAELREADAAIRHQATHDPLTGLANRALFMDRIQTALDRAQRRNGTFALAYIDIDDFKPVNDTHGHHVGDALLQAVADRLRGKLRKDDTVARLGGDEFALILEGALEPPRLAQRLCDEIVATLCAPYVLGAHTVRVGASLGLALYPAHGGDCDALIVAADDAMYRAKRSGKNRSAVAPVRGPAV